LSVLPQLNREIICHEIASCALYHGSSFSIQGFFFDSDDLES
jgi:hypothetical protein